MRFIRETLVGSSLAFAITAAGVTLAESDQRDAPRASDASLTEERVMSMQRALMDRGLYQGRVDGVSGPQTAAALREFQYQNGLAPTGRLNLSTANALGINAERQPVAGTDPAPQPQVGSTAAPAEPAEPVDPKQNVELSSLNANQAKELQSRLQLLGFYRGEIDGVIGSGTRSALQRFFQEQANLAAQGVISNAAIGMFGTEVQDVAGSRRGADTR